VSNKLVKELTASEWVFLTLGAGLSLQPNDKVIFKSDLADRTSVELAGKVTVSDEFKFEFEDADVAIDPGNIITSVAHGMVDSDPVRLTTTGELPEGLMLGIDYYVVGSTLDTFQLALTVGGDAVEIVAAIGGGVHSVHKMRAKLEYSNFEIIVS